MPDFNSAPITTMENLVGDHAADDRVHGGRLYDIGVTIETPAILAIGEKLVMLRIPVDAVITSIQVATDDLGTTGDLDLGFYRTIVDGGAAVDADAILSDLDVNAAAVALAENRFTVLDINTVEQAAWQLAGLSARPAYDLFDIAFAATEATTAIGTVTLIMRYKR